MKTIKVICTNHPEHNDIFYGCNKKWDWRYYLGGVYLDGAVEEAHGFDCVNLTDFEGLEEVECCDSTGKKHIHSFIPSGIYNCEVYGYSNPCTLFIKSEIEEVCIRNFNDKKRPINTLDVKLSGLIIDNTDSERFEKVKNDYNLHQGVFWSDLI